MRKVHLISQSSQIVLIILIIFISVTTNLTIIINISNCDIKTRIVSFNIIKYLCIVDLLGACLVLPIPLTATIEGKHVENFIFKTNSYFYISSSHFPTLRKADLKIGNHHTKFLKNSGFLFFN